MGQFGLFFSMKKPFYMAKRKIQGFKKKERKITSWH
jgi:hypothetical protein